MVQISGFRTATEDEWFDVEGGRRSRSERRSRRRERRENRRSRRENRRSNRGSRNVGIRNGGLSAPFGRGDITVSVDPNGAPGSGSNVVRVEWRRKF